MRLLLVIALLTAQDARADYGAMLGARVTSLEGYIHDDDLRLNFAAAGIVSRRLSESFEVAAEPGIQLSGSYHYRFVYAVVPLLVRYAHRLTPAVRLRFSGGIAPAYLIRAYRGDDHEGNFHWNEIHGVATWEAGVLAGAGVEVERTSGSTLFAELRLRRGIVTVDGQTSPLVIFNQEVGLWLGVTR
jgi:hypothetical protein